MRSFAIALFAAAVATFTSAAPAGPALGNTVTNELKNAPRNTPGKSSGSSDPALLGGEVEGLHLRRGDLPSVAVIFADLEVVVEPLVDELLWLVPSNATVSVIADISDKIKVAVNVAIPKLKALVGADLNVILAGTDGKPLTVVQLAVIVGGHLNLVLGAVVKVLGIVDVKISVQVAGIFKDLGALLTTLIQAVLALVGLDLSAVVKPVADIIAQLHLDVLAKLCGL